MQFPSPRVLVTAGLSAAALFALVADAAGQTGPDDEPMPPAMQRPPVPVSPLPSTSPPPPPPASPPAAAPAPRPAPAASGPAADEAGPSPTRFRSTAPAATGPAASLEATAAPASAG